MTRVELLLVQLGVEAAEVAQEVSKCLRFGPEEVYPTIGVSNADRILDEFNDVIALVEMLQNEGVLRKRMNFDDIAVHAKKLKVEKHLEYSRKCGRLCEK